MTKNAIHEIFEILNKNGHGCRIGNRTMTPSEAAASNGLTVVEWTNHGTVLCNGGLIISDVNGPCAVDIEDAKLYSGEIDNFDTKINDILRLFKSDDIILESWDNAKKAWEEEQRAWEKWKTANEKALRLEDEKYKITFQYREKNRTKD